MSGLRSYPVPRERSLPGFLLLASGLLATLALLGRLVPPVSTPATIEVELGLDAVENEPPPLGDPAAGAGAKAPEPQPEPDPAPTPDTPPPEPEPQPIPPAPAPVFVVPEEMAPPPPRPKPAAPAKEKPKRPAPASVVGSGEATGEEGVRGSPGGVPGGKGGGRGDFVATPAPQYDETARARHYQGHGLFLIRYENGQITVVSMAQSTGAPYLDARTATWIQARWRVKPGVSGVASLPVTWQLR